jgi:nucleoside-diphosphate-sugar epimerase
MKILIAGCGYLGLNLAANLIDHNAQVWAVRRSWKSTDLPEALQLPAFHRLEHDLLKEGNLSDLPRAEALVFCQAPSRDSDSYRAVYYEATQRLVWALEKKKPKKIIFISSTSVYGSGEGYWVDERTQPSLNGYKNAEAGENARWLLAAEDFVLSCGIPAVIFRLGGIYGPGRHRLRAIRDGIIKPVFSDVYVNRVHIEDVVSGIRLLIEEGKRGEIYLGVDDYPSTQKEYYTWVCDKLGMKHAGASDGQAAGGHSHGSNKRCSNAKMKELGWRPRYPSFREGYRSLIEEFVKS